MQRFIVNYTSIEISEVKISQMQYSNIILFHLQVEPKVNKKCMRLMYLEILKYEIYLLHNKVKIKWTKSMEKVIMKQDYCFIIMKPKVFICSSSINLQRWSTPKHWIVYLDILYTKNNKHLSGLDFGSDFVGNKPLSY